MAAALLLAMVAAAAAALIVFPAPSVQLARIAIAASEKSLFIAAAAVVALALAIACRRPGGWVPSTIAGVLALGAVAASLIPVMGARYTAKVRGVTLELGPYLRGPIDSEGPGRPRARPDRSVAYQTIAQLPPRIVRESTALGPKTLGLDVYLPPPSAPRPSRPLLVIHGGFWSAGQRGEAALASRRFADLGFTVFDVEYTIAPQPNWKAAIGDIKCAIGWVKAHAKSTEGWDVDPSKLVLLGRSAGAHLALMAAYAPDDPALPPSCKAEKTTGDTSVDAVVALYAPTDLVWGYDHPSNPRAADSRERMRAFVGGTLDSLPGLYRSLSPTARVTPRAPRTLLVHGGRDQIVSPVHMDRLAARLEAAHVTHDTLLIPDAQHAFDFFLDGFSSQLLQAALRAFLAP